MRIDFNRLRPGLAIVGRSRQNDLRVSNPPTRPTNVEIARVTALRVVRNDVGLVLERNPRLAGLFGDRNVIRLPGFATVERAAHKNSIASGAMCPVVEGTELVESDVADEGVSLIVKDRRHVARDTIVLWIHALRHLPRVARVR